VFTGRRRWDKPHLGFQRGGFTEEESRSVVAALAREVIDVIEVNVGSYEQPAKMGSMKATNRPTRTIAFTCGVRRR
jgi:hypothetical protein